MIRLGGAIAAAMTPLPLLSDEGHLDLELILGKEVLVIDRVLELAAKHDLPFHEVVRRLVVQAIIDQEEQIFLYGDRPTPQEINEGIEIVGIC